MGALTEREAESHLLGLELFGMRFGLERMHRLTTALGLPQRRFAQIHVVGTNGKTSTVRFAAAILERHGLRTGAYTSPHIGRFRERIQVGEQAISADDFAAAVQLAVEASAGVERTLEPGDAITQFELLTAAAFHAFAAAKVDVVVIEAGLGGRYDATNVIPSQVQVLTSVALEHTRWLGDTVEEIAAEKLAVVRDHATVVAPGDLPAAVERVLEQVAASHHATLVRARADGLPRPAALGEFQRSNFAVAAAAAEAFAGHPLDPRAVAAAAAETVVPGRLQVIDEAPLTVLDSAHNPAGATALAASLDEVLQRREPLVIVASVLDDKDARELLAALAGRADRLVFTRCANPRAVDPRGLAELAAAERWPAAEVVAQPRQALARARELAGPDGAVVVAGSAYLVADLVREPSAGPGSTI